MRAIWQYPKVGRLGQHQIPHLPTELLARKTMDAQAFRVAIIMGSASDLPIMEEAAKVLDELEVGYELTIVSAHRTPERMYEFARGAREKGFGVIVAGAGGAAHLPGMVASLTSLPVVGVPIKSSNSIDGWDSVLSILQMPSGIPVATVALNGAKNAGLLAARMLGATNSALAERLDAYQHALKEKVMLSVEEVAKKYPTAQ